MATDPERVKTLFPAAIERGDPGDRRAFLDADVGNDAELRGRLDALLAAYDRPPNVLDRPLGPSHRATDGSPSVTSLLRGAIGDESSTGADPDLVLDVDAALERLAQEYPSSAEVARHRLFAGSSIDETADAMGISRATAVREWAYARSWLATA
jgi:hypothetical protein